MAEEQCLCLLTVGKLWAIKLSNLKKLEDDVVKDWTCPFVFDSKIYMVPSSLDPPYACYPIPVYEFIFEERKIVKAESPDPAPFPLYSSFVVNTPGSGDVYFYTDLRVSVKDSPLFYVLSPGSKIWKSINPPSNFRDPEHVRRLFHRSRGENHIWPALTLFNNLGSDTSGFGQPQQKQLQRLPCA
ncbi:hypothetical protein PIB30_070895 [Stylosanthes scabra]|uniref:Uncharacterized protein n=1 Tax=Stylosanthes scabra TaxID=79078 RepID=A0ABU6XM24_9FABA|nr:hypothetical protein [Stylosanthes scabra]